ncbi:MAG: hypothetical protein ACKO8I_10080 [Cyanobacteriota bacterium]
MAPELRQCQSLLDQAAEVLKPPAGIVPGLASTYWFFQQVIDNQKKLSTSIIVWLDAIPLSRLTPGPQALGRAGNRKGGFGLTTSFLSVAGVMLGAVRAD